MEVERKFREFCESPQRLFIIVGESGRGKTNLVCDRVRECEYPSLLFLGEQYQESAFCFPDEVDATIGHLLKSASADGTEAVNVGDINKMASEEGGLFLVFLDALNEFRNPASVLESLTNWLMGEGRELSNVCICLTCRNETWRYLTFEKQVFGPSRIPNLS
jgi:hypothetical protein